MSEDIYFIIHGVWWGCFLVASLVVYLLTEDDNNASQYGIVVAFLGLLGPLICGVLLCVYVLISVVSEGAKALRRKVRGD